MAAANSSSMVATISPAECTVAHVFEHIQKFEDQANEELGMEIDFGTLPAPFDMRKTDEGLYWHQRLMKVDYLPVIENALGIRNYVVTDSVEDVALAEAHSLKWYYVAIRPQRDLFTLIKYRSSKPCPSFVLQMVGLTGAYHAHQEEENFDVLVPCGTLETADVDGVEPQESEAVAKRLWGLATDRGGSLVLLSPKEGGRNADVENDGDAKEPWIRMSQDDLDDLDELWSEVNPTAAQLAAERAARPGELPETTRKQCGVIMRQAKRRHDDAVDVVGRRRTA